MKRKFYATQPGRYVRRESNFVAKPDVPHELKNEITGYMMLVDFDAQTYDSFIKVFDIPDWQPYSLGKKLTSFDELWYEVRIGALVESEF